MWFCCFLLQAVYFKSVLHHLIRGSDSIKIVLKENTYMFVSEIAVINSIGIKQNFCLYVYLRHSHAPQQFFKPPSFLFLDTPVAYTQLCVFPIPNRWFTGTDGGSPLIYIQTSGEQVLHCQYVVNINFNGKSCFVSLMECLSPWSVFFCVRLDGAGEIFG